MLKTQESAENYLEAILILNRKFGSVRSVDIANFLGFSKPSVSVAMKNLKERGCIVIDGKGNIYLTDHGNEIAEMIYERHTLITNWLVQLGVDKEVAAEDACRIEHVISPESFQAIKTHVNSTKKE